MDGSHNIPRQAVTQEAGSVRPERPRRLLAALAVAFGACLLLVGALAPAMAAPTVSVNRLTVLWPFDDGEVEPLRQWPGYSNARYDATLSSVFRYRLTVQPSSDNASLVSVSAYCREGGFAMDLMGNYPNFGARGGQDVPVDITGYALAGLPNPMSYTQLIFWSRDTWPRTLRIEAWEADSQGNLSRTIVDAPQVIVGPSGREVLIPVDAQGQPDFYRGIDRESPNTGGLTVTPADGANDDDGTSSTTYTFRVKYIHPDGLPPRIPQSQLGYPPTRDVWRFPTYPDATLPNGVQPPPFSTGVGLYFDTDALRDCDAGTLTDWVNSSHKVAAATRLSFNSPLVHFMTIDTELQPQYAGKRPEDLTAQDWMNGVIFRYVIVPTSHEVAVGLPHNLFNGETFGPSHTSLDLLTTFGQVLGFIGVRYVDGDYRFARNNNRRDRGSTFAPGGRDTTQANHEQYTAPFLALAAGRHAFTYRTTSDFTEGSRWCNGATAPSYDSYGNIFQEIHRFPDYNAPAIHDVVAQPSLVFPEVGTKTGWMQFQKPFVNPALDTDTNTAVGSPPGFEIRIPTPVTVPQPLRAGVPSYRDPSIPIGGATGTDPEVILIDATRVLSAESMRLKVYYTHSEGVGPILAQVLLFQRQADGTFPAAPTLVKPLLEDTGSGSYRTGRAYYYDAQLPPGEYRYYFRFNDGTRTVEWPGDSQAKASWAPDGTSLTTSLKVSHLANTVVVNHPCELSSPQVNPAFGNTGTPFVYEVTYRDANNDPPRYAYLFIGTHQVDVQAVDLGTKTITVTGEPFVPDSYVNGEIAVVLHDGAAPPDAFRRAVFPVTGNGNNTFTVTDPYNILNQLHAGDRVEIRRRVEMVKVGTGRYDSAAGVKYRFDTATDSTIKLQEGTRSFHFAFTDNWGTPEDPEIGETTRLYNGVNNEIQGPVVQDNRVPTLTGGSVTQPNDNVLDPDITGTSATLFTYRVRYSDPDNNPPSQMQVIIDPVLTDLTGGASYQVLTAQDRTVTVSGNPWTPNQFAGRIFVPKSGAAANRWYVVATNTGNTLTLVSGSDVDADGVQAGDQFDLFDVTGDTKAMTPSNPSDTLYTDGADFEVTTRLGVGRHYYIFRASDGFTTLYSTTKSNAPFDYQTAPNNQPLVNPNRPPRLRLANVTYDGSTTPVVAVDASSITVPGVNMAAHETKDRTRPLAIEVLQGAEVMQGGVPTALVREVFEIVDNDATQGGTTRLYTRGNPQAAGVQPGADCFRLAPYPLSKVVGVQGDTFTWTIAYYDADNDSPESGAPAMMRLIADNDSAWSAANITRTKVDPSDQNYADGVVYQFTTNALGSGAHTYYFEANDGANAVRFPASGILDGPAVNNPPQLSNPTITPLAGGPTTMYRFEVTYKDADNDAPVVDVDPAAPDTSYPRAVLRDPSGNIVPDPTNLDASGNPQPFWVMRPVASGSYVNGVVFRRDFQASDPGLASGRYTVTFEAASVGANRTQFATLGPNDGPYVNRAPSLRDPVVVDQAGNPNPTGSRMQQYTYRVTYSDPEGHAPSNVTLTIKKPDGSTIGSYSMAVQSGASTTPAAYQAGVVYEYTTPAGFFSVAGTHSFTVDASDNVPTPYVSFPAAQVTGTGPTIDDVPVLTNLTVDPPKGGAGTTFTFRARYTHTNGTEPAGNKLLLFIYKPSGALLVPGGNDMLPETNDPVTTGRVYQAQVALQELGQYKFYVKCSDGADGIVEPGGADTNPALAVQAPLVAGRAPVLSEASVTPDKGYRPDVFVYRVKYTDLDEDAPAFISLTIDGQPVPAGDIQREDNNPYSQGTVYKYTRPAGSLTLGSHTYAWSASDGTTTVYLPPQGSKPFEGPVVQNYKPQLVNYSVTPTAGRSNSEYIYTVTYKDADGDPPTTNGVMLILDGQAIQMEPADPNARDYVRGIIYTYRKVGMTPGPHTYQFTASDGYDDVKAPDPAATAPTVNYPPVLSAPRPTVTPAVNDPGAPVTFRITYQDGDGDLPSGGIRVFIHNRPPSVPDNAVGGYVMSPASGGTPTPAEIKAGVEYTVTVNGLAKGAYSHYFTASDGTETVVFPTAADTQADKRIVGPTMNWAPVLTLPFGSQGVNPVVGDVSDSYTFEVVYTQRQGDPAQYVKVFIDGATTGIAMTPVPGQNDPTAGITYRVTLPGGVAPLLAGLASRHTFHFAAKDSVQEVFLDKSGLAYDVRPSNAVPFDGPRVNNQCALSGVRILASPSTDFSGAKVVYPAQTPPLVAEATDLVRFEVTYRDANNDAPVNNELKLYLDGSSTPLSMTEATVSSDPNRWQNGVVYQYTSPQPLAPGSHSFRIVADDGAKTTEVASGLTEAAPPVQTLANPRVTPTRGGKNASYTFAVSYMSFLGGQPNHLAGVQASAKITLPDGTVVTKALTTDPQGDARVGVVFQTSETLSQLGDYSFHVELNDGRFTYKTATVDAPKVAAPALSNATVTPAEAIAGRSFEFSVVYQHPGRQPAGSVKLFLYKADGSLVKPEGYAMATEQTDTALLDTVGWTYKASVPLDVPGAYSFKVEACDGAPGVGSTVVLPATGTIAGPTVKAPTLTEESVTPMTGGKAGGVFTFQVKYTYGSNRAPAWVRLRITEPDGTELAPVEMVAASTGDYLSGKLYTKSVTLRKVGQYRFYMEASVDGATVSAVSATVDGPVTTRLDEPVLTQATVQPAAGGGNRYTYRVVYQQAQGFAPAWVRLYIDVNENGEAARVVDMAPETAGDTRYADPGVAYVYTTPEALAAGRHNFQIRASTGYGTPGGGPDEDGEAVTPVLSGPVVNTAPTLEAQAVTPARGDENTVFTFAAIYKDEDNQPAEYVKVSVGNKTIVLTQADPNDTNYRDGALYKAQTQLPAGELAHSFLASDGVATVRAPASGVISGPQVFPKTEITLAVSRAQVALDAVSSVTVTGTLSPAVANAPVTVTFSVATPQADGSTVDVARPAQTVQTNAEGKFTLSRVPDQDGVWTVRAEYAGDLATGGTRGSGVGTAQFTVDPARVRLSQSLYMVGLPVPPPADSLQQVFVKPGTTTPARFQTAVWSGDASTGYVFGPQAPFPAVRPGMGFWLRAGEVMDMVARGRLVDHTKEFVIPVRPGWQQIGNPFLLPVDWASVQFSSGGQRMTLAQARAAGIAFDHAWVYDGVANEYRLVHATAEGAQRNLAPWQGAWFLSRVAGEIVLPVPSNRAEPDSAADRAERARHRGSEREWSIRLRATNGTQSDSYNYAGVTGEGRAAVYAALESPPTIAGYVDLYFTDPGEGRRCATDYRAPSTGEQVWNLVVETDVKSKPVTVSAVNLAQVPKNLEVLLEDVDAGGKRTYLRTSSGYTFNPGESGQRHLRLIVRPRSEASLRVTDITVTAARGGRAIGYVLSRDALVTVDVLSPAGQRVKRVADRQAVSEGRSTVVWDGTREDGAQVPAGIYLVQVTATTPEGQTVRQVKPVALTR